jgi:hypothetical protein
MVGDGERKFDNTFNDAYINRPILWISATSCDGILSGLANGTIFLKNVLGSQYMAQYQLKSMNLAY